MVLFLVILATLTVVNCATDCRRDWGNQKQCIDRDRNQFTATSQMSDRDRSEVKRKLSQCYLDENCNDPFPNDQQDQARRQCFLQVKDRFVKELQDCVRRNYPDYDIPTSTNGNKDWGQYVIQMKKAKCQARDKKRFSNCMAGAMNKVRTNGRNQQQNGNNQQQKPDPCEVRYQCYQKNMNQQCYDRQSQVKKELCTCVTRLNIENYKSDYSACMKRSSVNVANDNDFNYASFDKLKDKYCKQTQDPCGGYTGRQAVHSKNNGNRPQSNNNGGGFNHGPGGNQGNGGNWQGGGNQGNNWQQGGSSGSSSGGQDYNSGNYDFSSVGGDDDGFPAIGNVISNGGSSSSGGGGDADLGSFVNSANTGFDPSSFLGGGGSSSGGGGDFFSQLTQGGGGLGGLSNLGGGGLGGLSNLGGGGLGGLSNFGGGGLGSGLLGGGGGGGSGFDISSILSGIGGGKKKK